MPEGKICKGTVTLEVERKIHACQVQTKTIEKAKMKYRLNYTLQ